MSIKIQNNNHLTLTNVCFGHHGQISIILKQIRCYFLYKGIKTKSQEKALLETICCNVKHFIMLSKNQPFLPYEKNCYAYYLEKIAKRGKTKMLFLDLIASQTLLTSEYNRLLTNGLNLPKSVSEQIIIESKGCENCLNEQIKA